MIVADTLIVRSTVNGLDRKSLPRNIVSLLEHVQILCTCRLVQKAAECNCAVSLDRWRIIDVVDLLQAGRGDGS